MTSLKVSDVKPGEFWRKEKLPEHIVNELEMKICRLVEEVAKGAGKRVFHINVGVIGEVCVLQPTPDPTLFDDYQKQHNIKG